MTAAGRPPREIDWETIERVADQAERSRLEAQSPEELERELREAGLDPEEADRLVQETLADTTDAHPSDDAAPLRVVDGGVRKKRGPVPSSRIVAVKVSAWLAATAVAAGFIVLWFAAPAVSPPEGTPQSADARQLRDQAAQACGQESWTECESKLDEARKLDPDGERAPRVVEERRAIASHRR
jgi:hypothetical protein